MIGIASYGAHIPMYRLSCQAIGAEWGYPAGRGERAVCNYDEDSITMAVEAVTDCLRNSERSDIDGLYLASTTFPYLQKQSASIVAAACDLRSELFTVDFASSLRAGTHALKCAIDAIGSGTQKKVSVVASDCRLPAPNTPFELISGDGAASFLLTSGPEVAVTIEASYSTSSEFLDFWKTPKDTYIRSWEDRFVLQEGFMAHVIPAVSEFMKRHNLSVKEFDKVALYAPDARSFREVAEKLGFDLNKQLQDPMFDKVGHTGTAFVMMMLVAALEESKPGESILLINYSDGVDCFVLRVTDNIDKIKDRRGVRKNLVSKMMLPNYGKYIRFRNLMQWETELRPLPPSSLPLSWRERQQLMKFRGSRCQHCGTIQWPMQRVCTWCQTKDRFDEVRLSDKRGTLFTFSLDERAPVPDPPDVVCIVDFADGGRFFGKMTDRDPEKLEVGVEVELTFRRIHDGQGIYNYFWKIRPVR